MARRLREIFSATAAKAIYPKKDVLPLLVAKKSGMLDELFDPWEPNE